MFSYDKKANLNNRTELQGFQFFKTPILRLDLQSCGRRSVPQICFALYLTETTTSSFLQIFPQLFVWYANSRLQVTNLLSTWRTDFCKVLKIATFQNRIFRLLTSRTQNKAYAQSNILSVKFFFFQLYDGDVLPPYFSRDRPCYPVVYRQYIYFLSDEDNKERFMQSPQKFLQQASPKPLVPIKVAIIGPPKSGKTTRKVSFKQRHHHHGSTAVDCGWDDEFNALALRITAVDKRF